MITDMRPGTSPIRQSAWSGAGARGFEPRMGANPNRISSPFAAAKATVIQQRQPRSTQVSGVAPGKATKAVAGRRNASWAITAPLQPHLRSRSATAQDPSYGSER